MMNIHIEIDEIQLRKLVSDWISSQIGYRIDERKLNIQVKSSQNWKSEWETAKFRAVYEVSR